MCAQQLKEGNEIRGIIVHWGGKGRRFQRCQQQQVPKGRWGQRELGVFIPTESCKSLTQYIPKIKTKYWKMSQNDWLLSFLDAFLYILSTLLLSNLYLNGFAVDLSMTYFFNPSRNKIVLLLAFVEYMMKRRASWSNVALLKFFHIKTMLKFFSQKYKTVYLYSG